jgi:hypothetical protein
MKTMFVWENVGGLTGNYHDGGGTVVIAESLDAARQLLPPGCDAIKEEPSFTASVVCEVDQVFIFPDAGCC